MSRLYAQTQKVQVPKKEKQSIVFAGVWVLHAVLKLIVHMMTSFNTYKFTLLAHERKKALWRPSWFFIELLFEYSLKLRPNCIWNIQSLFFSSFLWRIKRSSVQRELQVMPWKIHFKTIPGLNLLSVVKSNNIKIKAGIEVGIYMKEPLGDVLSCG